MSGAEATWITGVGLATPLGQSYDAFAAALLRGESGVRPVSGLDVSEHDCRIAGLLDPIAPPDGWSADRWARLGPWEQLLDHCLAQALRDAGLDEGRDGLRIGLALGLGAEWLLAWEADIYANECRRVHEPERDRHSLLDHARATFGLTGPSLAVAAACASGNLALAQGREWLERGWVDVCLAGAVDRSVTPMGLAGFGNLGALSKRNDAPAAASRPFDLGRDGFVMGEGGALFVMENASRARRRGARAYGELAGVGASSDAYHLVAPSPDPTPAARALNAALADAGIGTDGVDYINAHATSTPVGDRFETQLLHRVFGPDVRRIPVSATKSMTGHLLGATSAVEAAACLVAIGREAIPPTINLDVPDPECDLLHVAGEARPARLRVALSNSFGFGGSNTCVVLRRVG
jgi:3-oxoacyl-[acyl-carrier-protein] synthase II